MCKSCHLKKTKGEIEIHGWKQTSGGKQLDYETTSKKKTKKKFSEQQVEEIYKYKETYLVNPDNCRKLLYLKLNLDISKQLLKKIMNQEY